MAINSDTNNRYLPDSVEETKLDGEVPGFDYSIAIPGLNETTVVEDLEDLNVEISRDKNINGREGVKILYQEPDQDQVYDLIR